MPSALSATVSMSREAPPAVASASRKSSASRSSDDRVLSLSYGGTPSRSAQPSREQLFAEVRARARKQLEQRGGTEDVEVARVQMIFGEEARSRCPDAVPCVFESRYAMVVERDGSRRRDSSARMTRSCHTASAAKAASGSASSQARDSELPSTSQPVSANAATAPRRA